MKKPANDISNFIQLEQEISISFNDKTLLRLALTHSSYGRKRKKHHPLGKDNERLEFLGDAVLKLIISDYLFKRFPDMDEGNLTKIRAQIVSDRTLAFLAKELNLGNYLLLSRGEINTGGKARASNLANALEALLGAYYLDQGIEQVHDFFVTLVQTHQQAWHDSDLSMDYKSTLQEMLQQHKLNLPQYIVLREEGPDHKKQFLIQAEIITEADTYKFEGRGRTKKAAEQAAAKNVLENLKL
ncbi:ribonuclease III [Thermoproteota archaeon]